MNRRVWDFTTSLSMSIVAVVATFAFVCLALAAISAPAAHAYSSASHTCPKQKLSATAPCHDCRKAIRPTRVGLDRTAGETGGVAFTEVSGLRTTPRLPLSRWPLDRPRDHVLATGLMLMGSVRLLN